MSIFKCKMCGGTLEISENMKTAVCEYCGTEQTLPKLDDEKKANMYDRANHFRRNNDYDKAMSIYENILNEDKTDAEAYWSIVLCRYGIEYVEDPKSHKRVPTVNRAQFTSIFMDEDYKSAIKYADISQKIIYEAEAKTIDEIQKGILAISQKEEPFDVFICYKETDTDGRRTRDSVIATDLYHQLTKEGFKVFFSRITLEDKLGTAYEPYIFAALNSSKVMVVLGTKPEFFNAVWVKNEWSRYLSLIRNGAEKVLIPAYRDMDPYDLPEEFSHLQAQDMSKLGFMQDLIRGIKKLTKSDEPEKVTTKETVVVNNNTTTANVVPLLKRAFMFLEDGEFERADDFCEQVLNQDPENAEAYLGKLMAELCVKKREQLKDCKEPFDYKNNYKKVYRFGDEKLKAELNGAIKHINERNENERLERIYSAAVSKMKNAQNQTQYNEVAEQFDSISEYKDSKTLAKKCREKGEEAYKESEYNKAVNMFENATTEDDCKQAKVIFEKLGDYKESKKHIDKYDDKVAKVKEIIENDRIYKKAKEICNEFKNYRLNDYIANFTEAAELFKSISGWKDADDQAKLCLEKIEKAKEDDLKYKQEEAKKKRNLKIFVISFSSVVTVIVLFLIVLNTVILPSIKYDEAESLLSEGKYSQARIKYAQIINYKDSKEKYKSLNNDLVSAGFNHTVGLKSDGTVIAVGSNVCGQCDVSDWNDITAVSAGYYHTVGLKNDGSVVVTGFNYSGQCEVSDWNDIVAVSAGNNHTVSLKSDGTVVAIGSNAYGQCDVSNWTDIVEVSAGGTHTVGLKSDGTVVAVGFNEYGRCNVYGWKDIVAVSAGGYHTVGLKSDGTVVATGDNSDGQCDVSDWKDIVAVSTGNNYTVGLKTDGTVVTVGYNGRGECNVSGWKNITAVSAGSSHTVGLKSDGTVIAVGYNDRGECEVSDWKDIGINQFVNN